MKEDFLHFLWKLRLIRPSDLKTTDGRSVIIIHPGTHNHNAGPDFLDSRIKIGDETWAGHVEIHKRTGDWNAHQHQHDPAYNNVILHVVHDNSGKAQLENQGELPILELRGLYDERYLTSYETLQASHKPIPCQDSFAHVPELTKSLWYERLKVDRLGKKTAIIKATYEQLKHDWNETFYILLARNFGFKVNAEAFELLARSLPFSLLLKHKDSIFQLEALLFGQAGLLDDADDAYASDLQSEYIFLSRKYGLSALKPSIWNFFRLMPVNFPTIRIAQLANLVHEKGALFSRIEEEVSAKSIKEILDCTPSDYWRNHYRFGKPSSEKVKALGESSKENILINTVAPTLFLYGIERGSPEHKSRAMSLWGGCKPESNAIIRGWKELGVKVGDASTSQALIHLKNEFCAKKKCLSCQIGVHILTGTE